MFVPPLDRAAMRLKEAGSVKSLATLVSANVAISRSAAFVVVNAPVLGAPPPPLFPDPAPSSGLPRSRPLTSTAAIET